MAKSGDRRKAKDAASERAPSGNAEDEKKAGRSKPSGTGEAFASSILGLSKLYENCGKDGVSPQVTDAVTQALLLILGSGPAIVTLDGLMAIQGAQAMMSYNAVDIQQKTNLLGMAMTARSVRYILDPYPDDIDEAVIVDKEAEGQ